MHWGQLFDNFLKGDPSSLQATFALGALLITFIGTIYIVRSFREQVKINKIQAKINKRALSKSRREARPYFTAQAKTKNYYELLLTNARALDIIVFDDDGFFNVVADTLERYPHCNVGSVLFDFKIDPNTYDPNRETPIKQLKFKDEDGRTYYQILSIDFNGAFCSFPEKRPKSKTGK